MSTAQNTFALHESETLQLPLISEMRSSPEFNEYCLLFEDIHARVTTLNEKINRGIPLSNIDMNALKSAKRTKVKMKKYIRSQYSIYEGSPEAWRKENPLKKSA